MGAWLSLAGLWTADNTIFDDFKIPEGIDKQVVIDSILWESAELEILIPRPSSFKFALKAWSEKRFATWARIWRALQIEYKPLENYNRTEERTLERGLTGEHSDQSGGTERFTPGSIDTTSKTGYNSGELQVTDQIARSGQDQTATTGTASGTSSESEDVSERVNAFGNIGVTTSQQMLESEIEVAQHNMIDIIVQEFIDSFCIMVY